MFHALHIAAFGKLTLKREQFRQAAIHGKAREFPIDHVRVIHERARVIKPQLGEILLCVQQLEACFRKTDYFLPSEREAVWLTGETGSPEKMAQALHKMDAANCVIKLGAQGCYVSADRIEAHIPSFPCRCVDTTGAGDTFVGSFLYAKSQGWDTLASARFACAAGSVAVEHVGANTAIRSKDQVLARMNGQ